MIIDISVCSISLQAVSEAVNAAACWKLRWQQH